MLFVHGAGNEHSVWALQSRYFAHHGWNALAVDLPAHGKSGGAALPPSRRWRIGSATSSTRRGSRRAALVGHSMGSLAALECAARHPERVTKLALVGPAAPMPVAEMLLDAAKRNDHVACELITGWSYSPGKQLGGSQVPGLWLTGNALAAAGAHEAGRALRRSRRVQSVRRRRTSAAKVRCPVLAILGARDLMAPAKNAQRSDRRASPTPGSSRFRTAATR